MLGRLLRGVFQRSDRVRSPSATTRAESTPQTPGVRRALKLADIHERAPLERHLDILFHGVLAGRVPLLEVTHEAIRRTGSGFPPLKVLHRRFSAANLAAYFLYARGHPGRWAECGVFNGYSSLALCLVARSLAPSFDGTGLHLIDSFEGLSPPGEQDYAPAAGRDGSVALVPPIIGNEQFRTSVEKVRAAFTGFPGVRIHQGWIPEVLGTLPDAEWSFVHIDVDLYAPTRACLEYFLPRLTPGGVVICDDYGSQVFPGAERAWDEVCTREGVPFVELPTGQAVILKAA